MQDRYYRHSGRFSFLSVAKALAAGLLAAGPLAFIYAYAIVYIPIVGVVTFILTGGFAALVGLAVGTVLYGGKVRNNAVTMVTSLSVSAFALWASWVAWVYAILHRGDADVALIDLVLNPEGLWRIINIINEKGAWNLKGLTPTGAALWCLWAVEAAIIVGLIVLVASSMVSAPFCETCEKWSEVQKFPPLGPTTKEELVPRMEQGDYAVLRALSGATATSYTQLDLHHCSQCQGLAALSATGVTITFKNGKEEKNEKQLLGKLLLSPGDLATVKTILAEGQGGESPPVQQQPA